MARTAARGASAASGSRRSEKPESRIRRRTGRRRQSVLRRFQTDRPIASPDAQRATAGAEAPLQRPPLALVLAALAGDRQFVANRAVARVRVELGGEVRRQIQ